MGDVIPKECQLCKLLDHNDDIREPTHSSQVAREDGGIKFVYGCKRCFREMGWIDQIVTDEIEGRGTA